MGNSVSKKCRAEIPKGARGRRLGVHRAYDASAPRSVSPRTAGPTPLFPTPATLVTFALKRAEEILAKPKK